MSVELGAYVLHALEDDESETVRRHVHDCPLCQDEVGELSFTASLLSLLKPGDLERLETGEHEDPHPEPTDRSTTASCAERDRRRPGRRAVLAGAVALLAAISLPVGRAALDDHAAPTAAATVLRATDPATQVRAAVTLASQNDGTHLHLSLSGAYPRGWCSLVARSRDGRTDTAATWRADERGTADVAGTTAIPAGRLRELDVVTDTGRVLVRIPVPHQNT
jgi:hypothetical protein